MYRKFAKALILALTTLAMVTTLALACGQEVSGKVTRVDTKKGRITLRTDDGKTHVLRAPGMLLANLPAGQMVEFKLEGNRVKSLKRQKMKSRFPARR